MVNVDDPEWVADCERWRGQLLTGRYAHWCFDWDELPVDETTIEFTCCHCFDANPEQAEIAAIREKLDKEWAEQEARASDVPPTPQEPQT